MGKMFEIPSLGSFNESMGLIKLDKCSDGYFTSGKDGVLSITATGDKKVEFIAFSDHTIAYVKSSMNYPAYYPVHSVDINKPVKAVLMDLDGTSVKSEEFWIWIIQLSIASLLGNPHFELEDEDLPYVSGHSVSEHLKYCISKYCPGKTVEEARQYYYEHTDREMKNIMDGKGKDNAFVPTPGLKEFLYELKARKIKIGLVTSGLYYKAWPEILSAFKTLKMGDPKDFYDAIITAGSPLIKGHTGTISELAVKPHPWLYAETCRVGLGIPFEERNSVIGIEDSGAGICSIRLAGYPAIGISGGNIESSGTRALCSAYCKKFDDILKIIK